jgi:hypothetical protein
LTAVREKKQVTYKGKPIKITADYLSEPKSKKGMEWGILGTKWKQLQP